MPGAKPGSSGHLPQPLAGLQTLNDLPGSERLPASPAVAIWDQQGQLAYFGPYSEGATCTSNNSFIEPILKPQRRPPGQRQQYLAVGCFCDWRAPWAPHGADQASSALAAIVI